MEKPMQLSTEGEAFVKGYEQLRLEKYLDEAGLWTIGWGHLIRAGETFDGPITPAQAEEIFLRDTAGTMAAVNRGVTVDLAQNEFDALVSLAYNIGPAAFAASTVLRMVNAGGIESAGAHFLDWNKVRDPRTGILRPSNGLTNRRMAERRIFLDGYSQ